MSRETQPLTSPQLETIQFNPAKERAALSIAKDPGKVVVIVQLKAAGQELNSIQPIQEQQIPKETNLAFNTFDNGREDLKNEKDITKPKQSDGEKSADQYSTTKVKALKKGRVAVVGAGVAGIVSAWELAKDGYEVVLFERERRVGGHTNTFVVQEGPDAGTAVDTGFIVFNNRNYPNFHRFLAELGCSWRWSKNMSFGYYDELSELQYGGTGLINYLRVQPSNLLSPRAWSMMAGLKDFGARAHKALESGELESLTLGSYIKKTCVTKASRVDRFPFPQFPEAFAEHYLLPMGAAIWSTSLQTIRDYPAESFLRFFENHGLLTLKNRPRWQTVRGGSHTYLKAFTAQFRGEVRTNADVSGLRRLERGGVELTTRGVMPERFDRAVIACHADSALKLLADASSEERRLLGAWHYQPNRAVLHTDESFLPPNRHAWASWNYRRSIIEGRPDKKVKLFGSLTYDMTRLQGLHGTQHYLLTLNPHREPRPDSVLLDLKYQHPIFDTSAVQSQASLPSLNGTRSTWFCGSYFGYGFHEDAVNSALAIAAALSRNAPQQTRP